MFQALRLVREYHFVPKTRCMFRHEMQFSEEHHTTMTVVAMPVFIKMNKR
jgi:hypothetical protein